eukprot:3336049-Pleurochrysis_carterae.AAC.2
MKSGKANLSERIRQVEMELKDLLSKSPRTADETIVEQVPAACPPASIPLVHPASRSLTQP